MISEMFARTEKQMLLAVIMSLLVALVVVLTIRGPASDSILIPWLSLLTLISIMRLILIHRVRKGGPGAGLQTVLVFCSGLLWGSLVWLLFDKIPFRQQMAVLVILTGLAAGAGVTYAENFRFHMAFLVPVVAQTSIWSMTRGDAVFIGLGMLMLVYIPLAGRLSLYGENMLRSHLMRRRELMDEIASRIWNEELLHMQMNILHDISALSLEDKPELNGCLARIIRMMEEKHPGMNGSVLLVDEDGGHLHVGAAPNLPEEYNRAVEGLSVGPQSGSCGTAVCRGRRVIVEDIATDPLWSEFRDFTLGFGLRACTSQPVFGEDGAVLGTFAIYFRQPCAPDARLLEMMDVVSDSVALAIDKHRRSAAIRSGEIRFSRMMEVIPDAIGVHRDGKWAYVNPAGVEMMGASSADEILGTPVMDRVHPDHRHAIRERIARALDDGGIIPLAEERLLRMNGEAFIAEVEGCRIEMEGRDAVLVAVRDITGRKQTEEERERLRIAVEQSAEAMLITDASGRIIYANPAAAQISGYALSDLQGRDVRELMGGTDGATSYASIVECLKRGETWSGTVSLMRPDGSARQVERRISPVVVDGRTRYHVCVNRDVTEERQQQARLEHSQRLESLGVLAGGIAHDFNNILAAILGNASLAGMRLGAEHEAARYISRIEQSSQRAADLCKQMLAYSGKGRFTVRPVNLSRMLRDIARLLEVSIARNAVLQYELDEHLPTVEADATQMQQVLMNLVMNASDALADASGRIVLRTGVAEVGERELAANCSGEDLPPGRYVFVEVEDSGCGMGKEVVKRLFDPFFTTKFTGRGLGMSAVLGIVRGHHGAITVDSTEGVGTRFRVLLPPSGEQEVVEVETEDVDDWRGQGVVLVVDDEENVRESAAAMLEEMGFRTLLAADGEDALEMIREYEAEISLVLLDMTMPRLDGRGCFERLRRMNPHPRVLICSGYAESDVLGSFADAEPDGFVAKPYRFEALRVAVKAVLAEKRD